MLDPQTPVRFTGGKYNGFFGVVAKACENFSSVIVSFEGKPVEIVEDNAHLTPLAELRAKQSDTEWALRGNPTP